MQYQCVFNRFILYSGNWTELCALPKQCSDGFIRLKICFSISAWIMCFDQASSAHLPLILYNGPGGRGRRGPRALHEPHHLLGALRLHRGLPARGRGAGTPGDRQGPVWVRATQRDCLLHTGGTSCPFHRHGTSSGPSPCSATRVKHNQNFNWMRGFSAVVESRTHSCFWLSSVVTVSKLVPCTFTKTKHTKYMRYISHYTKLYNSRLNWPQTQIIGCWKFIILLLDFGFKKCIYKDSAQNIKVILDESLDSLSLERNV